MLKLEIAFLQDVLHVPYMTTRTTETIHNLCERFFYRLLYSPDLAPDISKTVLRANVLRRMINRKASTKLAKILSGGVFFCRGFEETCFTISKMFGTTR